MPQKGPSSLYAKIESLQDGDTVEVNIFLKKPPALEPLASDNLVGSHQSLDAVGKIRSEASASQRELLSFLDGAQDDFESLNENDSTPQAIVKNIYWINNSVTAEVTRQVLETILDREDVEYVELRTNVRLEDMLDTHMGDGAEGPDAGASPVPPAQTSANTPAEASPTIKRIGAPLMWREGLRGEGIIVAVIDSGVNYEHPDLKSHMWDGGTEFPNHGFDVVDPDNDPRDDNGHGTACAGIIAGDGASGEATGAAPKATIMAIRVEDEETALRGVEKALESGAHVISMSFSKKHLLQGIEPPQNASEPDSPRWRRTCENIFIAGVLHANSAGNNGNDLQFLDVPRNIGSPADCPPPSLHPLQVLRGRVSSVISCGATDADDKLEVRSSRGPVAWNSPPFSDYPFDSNGKRGLIKPDICAPGLGSRSCNSLFTGSNAEPAYRDFGNTSAAAAHVGGCLALLAQACKRSDKPIVLARIQEALESTAKPVVGQTQRKENNYGAGRVDVYAAYLYGKDRARKWWD